MQPICSPGFTLAGMREPLGTLSTIVRLIITPLECLCCRNLHARTKAKDPNRPPRPSTSVACCSAAAHRLVHLPLPAVLCEISVELGVALERKRSTKDVIDGNDQDPSAKESPRSAVSPGGA